VPGPLTETALEVYLSKEDFSFAAVIVLTIVIIVAIERLRRRR